MKREKNYFILTVSIFVIAGAISVFLLFSYPAFTPPNYEYWQSLALGAAGGALLSIVFLCYEFRVEKRRVTEDYLLTTREIIEKLDKPWFFHSYIPTELIRSCLKREAKKELAKDFRLGELANTSQLKDELFDFWISVAHNLSSTNQALNEITDYDDRDFLEFCKLSSEKLTSHLNVFMESFIKVTEIDLYKLTDSLRAANAVISKKRKKQLNKLYTEIFNAVAKAKEYADNFDNYLKYGSGTKLEMFDMALELSEQWFRIEPEYKEEYVILRYYSDVTYKLRCLHEEIRTQLYGKKYEPPKNEVLFEPQFFNHLHNQDNPNYKAKNERPAIN